jgi:DTW domain-containing protein YfiP
MNLWINYYKSLERSFNHITNAWNKGMCNLFVACNKCTYSGANCLCSNIKPVVDVTKDYYDTDFYVTGK